MDSTKYIGMDVHKEAISIAVLNSSGKLVMESIIETKAIPILQFIQGLRGSLHVTFEEGISNNVGPVKHFLSRLLPSLKRVFPSASLLDFLLRLDHFGSFVI
jgi:hypothetical protein